ncbi:MAG: protoheme IX farnesyltransferase, partial [Candidatus Dadabacteria bacterium]
MARGVRVSAAVDRLGAYWELTKPRITYLVLVTTFSGMWVAAGGMPNPLLVFLTLLGTGLAAGSSSTLNNFIDRHVDALMDRTSKRPLPTGRVSPTEALVLGIALGAASFALLATAVNLLAAALAVGTIFFYVVLYTALLKRRSPWCTSIGGIPGAAPPLIGWAAVSGDLATPAWVLFA